MWGTKLISNPWPCKYSLGTFWDKSEDEDTINIVRFKQSNQPGERVDISIVCDHLNLSSSQE